jgi:hypothetical protein
MSPDLSGIDRLHSYGMDLCRYTKRLGSVWYDSDIIWVVRTNCMRPQKTIRAEAVEEIDARQTIPARRG